MSININSGFCDCRLPLDRYPIGHEFDPDNTDFLDVGFRFVGLISLVDPPKAGLNNIFNFHAIKICILAKLTFIILITR